MFILNLYCLLMQFTYVPKEDTLELRYANSMMTIKKFILSHYYVIIATSTMSLGAVLPLQKSELIERETM